MEHGGMLGPYRIESVLGRGRSGTVYRALDAAHGDRVVALKVLHAPLAADPAFRARFDRDVAAVARLREPHVVPIHRWGEIGDTLFVDMRLVRGPSLADALRPGPLEPARAARVVDQLASAMGALGGGGLGARRLDRADVLLADGSGAEEFVQVVGLGLGHPPAPPGSGTDPRQLVQRPADWPAPGAAPARRRPRWWPLAATAGVLGVVALVVALVLVAPAEPRPPGPVATLDEADDDLLTAAAAVVDGQDVLATAAFGDGTVRVFGLRTGAPVGPPIPVSTAPLTALTTTVVEGRPVVVTRDEQQVIRVHDLTDGQAVGAGIGEPAPIPAQRGTAGSPGLSAVTSDGGPLLVSLEPTGAQVQTPATTAQYGLRVRQLPDGAPVGPIIAVPGESFGATASFGAAAPALTVLDGAPVAVVISGGRTLRTVDLRTGAEATPAIGPLPVPLNAVGAGERDGVPVGITATADNAVQVWDLRTGQPLGAALVGHTAPVASVHVAKVGQRAILVTDEGVGFGGVAVGVPARTLLWDLADGRRLGGPLGERVVAVAQTTGGPLVVTVPASGRPRVWDANTLMS